MIICIFTQAAGIDCDVDTFGLCINLLQIFLRHQLLPFLILILLRTLSFLLWLLLHEISKVLGELTLFLLLLVLELGLFRQPIPLVRRSRLAEMIVTVMIVAIAGLRGTCVG